MLYGIKSWQRDSMKYLGGGECACGRGLGGPGSIPAESSVDNNFRRWGPGICILTSSSLIFENIGILPHSLVNGIRDQIRKRLGIHQTSGSWESFLCRARSSGYGASGWGAKLEDRCRTAWRKHSRNGR